MVQLYSALQALIEQELAESSRISVIMSVLHTYIPTMKPANLHLRSTVVLTYNLYARSTSRLQPDRTIRPCFRQCSSRLSATPPVGKPVLATTAYCLFRILTVRHSQAFAVTPRFPAIVLVCQFFVEFERQGTEGRNRRSEPCDALGFNDNQVIKLVDMYLQSEARKPPAYPDAQWKSSAIGSTK
jgi:hypothetical protein